MAVPACARLLLKLDALVASIVRSLLSWIPQRLCLQFIAKSSQSVPDTATNFRERIYQLKGTIVALLSIGVGITHQAFAGYALAGARRRFASDAHSRPSASA